jgi:hypothetical protein
MTWEEAREKHKKLLEEWHELKKKLDPLDKACLAKEVGPNGDIEIMPPECLDRWCDLLDKQEEIFDKMAKIWRDYRSGRN